MSTKFCKDCKHWTRTTERYKRPFSGSCDSDKFVYQDVEADDQLAYWDYESYSAGFDVAEHFGCIHHEPRSDEQSSTSDNADKSPI